MKPVTIRRLLCALAILACAVLIGFRGGAAAFLLFWAAVLVPLLALLCRALFRHALLAELETDTEQVLRGERIPCTLVLHNRGILPIPKIRVKLIAGKVRLPEENGTGALCCALQPGETRRIAFAPLSLHCGRAEVGAAEILVPDYFALTQLRLRRTREIAVLPRTRKAETLLVAPPQETEKRRSARSYYGDAAPDGELRAYLPGDDLRRVHWKASARSGELIVRRLEPEPKSELVLIPDARAGLPEDPGGWFAADSILEGTLCIADYYLRHGVALRVLPDEKRATPVRAPRDWDRLQQLCAGDFFTGETRPDELLSQDIASGGVGPYILLTRTVDEALLCRVSRCIHRGVQVTLLCVGADSASAALARAQTQLTVHLVTPQRDIFTVLSGAAEGGAP